VAGRSRAATAYWAELAHLGDRGVAADVLVEVDGERITGVRPGVDAPPAATRLDGLVVPGLANAHSHAFQRLLRGRTQSARGSFWTWRERMYELAGRLDPDRYRQVAAATFAEMALAGITTVGEFHYLHHDRRGARYADPNAMGRALIAAAEEAGIRITLLDACYLHGAIGTEPEGTQRRFADADAAAWAERVSELEDAPGVRIGAAIHSVRAVDPRSASGVAGWAEDRRAPLHAHISEQPAENRACLDAYGKTPAAVLADAGAVGERFTAVHATHLADADFALLGGAGATCCLCPTTERDLADGIGPARRLADAGARLALGTDSNAVVDLFEEARAVELDERLASGVRGQHSAEELLHAASAGGHACLGWPEAGRIEPGGLCDLVAVDLDGVRLATADRSDPVPSLVFAGAAADVRDVVVGGRLVVAEGRHGTVEVGALRQLAAELA
jgi:formiminoglutamate deiminase